MQKNQLLRFQIDNVSSQISDDQVQKLANHCCFDKFKNNASVNFKPGFFRKGKIGDWKNHFVNDINLKAYDKWIENSNTEKIPFTYE